MSLLYFARNYGFMNGRYFVYNSQNSSNFANSKIIKYWDLLPTKMYFKKRILNILFRCETVALWKRFEAVTAWEQWYSLKNLGHNNPDVYVDDIQDETEELLIADDGLRQNRAEINSDIGIFVNSDSIGKRIMNTCHNWKESRLTYPDLAQVMAFLDQYKFDNLNISDQQNVTFQLSNEQNKVKDLVITQIRYILKNRKG